MRELRIIIVILLMVGFLACREETNKKGQLADFIPANSEVVLKIRDFESFNADLGNNALFSGTSNSKTDLAGSIAKLSEWFQPKGETLLCSGKINDSVVSVSVISYDHPGIQLLDSLSDKTVETLSYNDFSLQRLTIDNEVAYTTVVDSIFLSSTSQKVLEDILDGKIIDDSDFTKIFGLSKSDDLYAIFNAEVVKASDSADVNFANWIGIDTHVLPDGFTATGVALARDTVPQLLRVFEGIIPKKNEVQNVMPTEFDRASVFTFSDSNILLQNLNQFRRSETDSTSHVLFGSIAEIGEITFKEGAALVMRSIDASLTEDVTLAHITELSEYRDVFLYQFDQPELFSKSFSPLVTNPEYGIQFRLDNFFVFTTSEEIAQKIIGSYKNNLTLGVSSHFEAAAEHLGSSSSLMLLMTNNSVSESTNRFLKSSTGIPLSGNNSTGYPLGVVQFTYDRDFAHVSLVGVEKTADVITTDGVNEQFNLALENNLLAAPQLFTNHRTKEKDVAVQDINNALHLISASGKILWSKTLDSPILGSIKEVDLLRNGKKQLAFVTESGLYVLDRNGRDVSPFPVKFRDKITQPLSLFDYDKNRNYRFLVVQGKDLLMYDRNARIVKGFTFKSAASEVVQPPQHIRMNNKDYIIVAESSGILNILSRTGKTRVPVDRSFEFSEIPVANEAGKFVVITMDKIKVSITPSGTISSQKLNVAEGYWFATSGSTKVTIDDNLLRINGKLTELPFGIYTRPQIVQLAAKKYVVVTETQEKKVYLYDTSGTLQAGFPVYGTSLCSIGRGERSGNRYITVQGGPNEIILYAF